MSQLQLALEEGRLLSTRKCEFSAIRQLTAQGKWVVAVLVENCCPFTDALLSVDRRIIHVCDTEREARRVAYGEVGADVYGYSKLAIPDRKPKTERTEQELPF